MRTIPLSILCTLFLLPIAMLAASTMLRGIVQLFVLIGDVGFTALLVSIVFGLFFRRFKWRK